MDHPDGFDLFFSHARADWLDPSKGAAMRAMLEALQAAGLRVFHDGQDIADGESITRRITEGLGRSRLFLVWYSATYSTRRACQWELTAAILAARQDPDFADAEERRLLVLNPEPGLGHIQPLALADRRAMPVAGRDWAAFAADVKWRLALVAKPFGAIRAGLRPRWYGSPERFGSPRFVGRVRDLWAVHDGLARHDTALVSGTPGGGAGTVQVQGMGGIGKTMLAEEYAIRFASAWPGGVFWLSAGGALDIQQRGIAEQLRLPIQGLKPEEIAGLLRAALEQRAPYLWVVDDLPATAGQPDLLAWKAPTPNGHTLVTTRSRRLAETTFTHALDRLDEDDAHTLLTDRRPPKGPQEEAAAREMLTLLDNHALAVDVAGAAIRVEGYERYLKSLRNPAEDALAFAAKVADELPTGHTAEIAATLLDSLGRLNAKGRRVLHLAALLAPAPIPVDFIGAVFGVLAGDPDVGQDQATLGLKAVTSESLGKHLPTTEGQPESLSVHVLVSHMLRHYGEATTKGLRDAVMAVLLDAFRQHAGDIRQHAAILPLLPHARLVTSGVVDDKGADLLGWLGRLERERGSYDSAARDFQRELEAIIDLRGPEHPDTLASMSNLATTLGALGDHRGAQEIQKRELEISQRVLGREHPDTLISMSNLADTLRAMGDYSNAKAIQEQVLDLCRWVLGPEHPSTLTGMNNLATTFRAIGDYQAARALHEQALGLRRRVLGLDHPDTLASMHNLAGTLQGLGDLSGARELLEQALVISRRVLGPEHPDTLNSVDGLAAILLDMGDYASALAMVEEAQDLRRSNLGAEHPQSIASLNNLASIRAAIGDQIGARALQERALEISSRTLGPEHPDTLKGMNNLAATLRSLGELQGARTLAEPVLNIRRRVLGQEHPDTLSSIDNLATTLASLGDYREAGALLQHVLDLRRRVLGPEHPDTLTSIDNLATTLVSLGDYREAGALLQHVLDLRRRVLGPEHPNTLLSMTSLASCLADLGEGERALRLLSEAIEGLRRILPPDHPTTLEAEIRLADVLHLVEKKEEAITLYRKVHEGCLRQWGPRHPATLAVMRKLGPLLPLQPLTLAFRLVLAGAARPSMLEGMRIEDLRAAIQTLPDEASTSPHAAQNWLEQKWPDEVPPVLWQAWMEETRGDELERLVASLTDHALADASRDRQRAPR